jgi:hypothetical protein
MKAIIVSIWAFSFISLSGCDNDKGSVQNSAYQQPKQIAQEVETGIVGDFKLVKVQGVDSVFVLKDGKISPITNWNWVVKNAPNKNIETVTKSELDSFTASGLIYK